MTLEDILLDIYALEDEMRTYEHKYGVLSETFYEAYVAGEEPPDEAWIQDWTAWASAYKVWLRRSEQYHTDALSTNPKFQAIIERSRLRDETEGRLLSEEVRQMFDVEP